MSTREQGNSTLLVVLMMAGIGLTVFETMTGRVSNEFARSRVTKKADSVSSSNVSNLALIKTLVR